MTASVDCRAGRHFWLKLLPAFFLLLPPPATESAEAVHRPIETVTDLVPLDHPEKWPRADWQSISRAELQQLLKAANQKPAPSADYLVRRAEYSAILKGSELAEGRFEFDIDHQNANAGFLKLDPLNLAVSDLTWSGRPAVWGSDPHGQCLVAISGTQGRLGGSWSLRGAEVAQGVVFDLRLPRAASSQFKLSLPKRFTLACDAGPVMSAASSRSADWRDWTIELGNQTACRVRLHETAPGSVNKPLVVINNSVTNLAALPEQLRIQHNVNLEVLDAPLSELLLATDASVDVHSVVAGSDTPLLIEKQPVDDRNHVKIKFDPPLRGSEHLLHIEATASLDLDRPVRLPQIEFPEALQARGRINLNVAEPLQLKKFTAPDDYLQIDSAARGDAISVQHYGTKGELSAVVGWPRAEAQCLVAGMLKTSPEQWEAQSHLLWQCRSGRKFSLRSRIPRGWEVIRLRLRRRSMPYQIPKDWRIENREGGDRELVVSLQEALTESSPVLLEVILARPPASTLEAVQIPALSPQDATDVENYFSAVPQSDGQLVLEPGSTFEAIHSSQLPEQWQQFSFWDVDLPARGEKPGFLSTATTPAGAFWLQSNRLSLNIAAEVRMAFAKDGIDEEFLVRGNTHAANVTRLHLFLTEPGADIEWQLSGAEGTQLSAQRLPTARHPSMDLPRSGELWELQFSPPLPADFSLIGTRQRALSSTGRAALLFVPLAETFQGTVACAAGDEAAAIPQFVVDGLTEIPVLTSNGEQGDPSAAAEANRWSYESPTAALSFNLLSETQSTTSPKLLSAQIYSQMTLAEGDWDFHRAVFQLHGFAETSAISWSLPAPANVTSVQLGDVTIPHYQIEDRYEVLLPADKSARRLTIDYQTPSSAASRGTVSPIPVPQFDVPTLRFDWLLALPAQIRPELLSANARQSHSQPGDRWQTRLFGPLAAVDDTTDTNPQGLGDPAPAIARDLIAPGAGNTAETVLSGWRTWEFTFASAPAELAVTLRNERSSRLAAYAILLFCVLAVALLRAARVTLPRRFAAFWLAGCLMLAMLVPAAYAELAGGLFIGSCLACLVPLSAQWIAKRNNPPRVIVPEGSTRRHVPLSAGCLLALLCCCGAEADESRSAVSPGRPEGLMQILIPYESDDPLGRRSDRRYVSRPWLDYLRSLSAERQRQLPYLISAADYDLDLTGQKGLRCKLRFAVTVFAAENDVKVRLPLSGMILSARQSCLVNGQPHPIFIDGTTPGFAINLPGPVADETSTSTGRRYDVEIEAMMNGQDIQERSTVSFRIPRVASSRLTIALPDDRTFAAVSLDDAPVRELTRTGDDSTQIVHVGNAEQVRLAWSKRPLVSNPKLRVKATTLTDVTPAVIQYRAQADYQVESGSLNHIVWNIPDRVAVKSVEGAAVAGHRVITDTNGRRRLSVEFRSPQRGQVDLSAQFLLPVSSRNGRFEIPAINLVPQGADVNNDAADQVFALQSPAEFRLQVQSERADVRSKVDSESLSARWSDTISPRATAFQIDGATTFPVRLAQEAPLRTVSTIFRGRISRRQLEWELEARMEIQNAFAHQHRLQVDPRLKIDEISVQQQGAERLRRYTKTQDQLDLFLKAGAIGNQVIRLKGTMPLRFPGDFQLPHVGFFNASLADSEFQLWQDADLTVALLGSGELTALPEIEAEGENSTGRLFVGRYGIPTETAMEEVRIHVSENSPQVKMDLIGALDMRTGVQKMSAVLRFRVTEGHSSTFSVRLPKSQEQSFEVLSPESYQRRQTDDGLELTFLSENPRQKTFIARLAVPIQAASGSLEIDPPFPVNAEFGDIYLTAVSDDDSLVPTNEFSGLEEADIPADLLEVLPDGFSVASATSYRGQPGRWRFEMYDARSQNERTIELSDTRIRLSDRSSLWGRTSFLVMPGNEQALTLRLPQGTEIQAILTDGDREALFQRDGRDVTVTLESAQAGQIVTLYWSKPPTGPGFGLMRHVESSLPSPRNFSVKQATVAVIPSSRYLLNESADAQRTAALEHALLRLEAEFDLRRAQITAGHTRQHELGRQFGALEQRLEALSSVPLNEMPTEDRERFLGRLGDLSDRLSDFQARWDVPREDVAPDGDVNMAATDSQTVPLSLAGLYRIETGGNRQSPQVSLWLTDRRWLRGLATTGGLLLLLAITRIYRRYVQFSPLDWLSSHPRVVWLAVGIGWSFLLSPWWIGPAICVLVLMSLITRRHKQAEYQSGTDFTVPQI